MSDPYLSQIILENNPQKIQKYIKNYLPNNPENLQRIYKELQKFSQTLNAIIQENGDSRKKIPLHFMHKKEPIIGQKIQASNKIKARSSSLKQVPSLKKNILNYFQKHNQLNIKKRQQLLVRDLKQKGLRPNSEDLPLGFKIMQKQQQKIVKPLKCNSNIIFKQNTEVIKCIQKFNLNPRFYSNTFENASINGQKQYDKQMKSFLDRRVQSLKKITAKQQFQCGVKDLNSRRFSHVSSKLYSSNKRLSQMSLGINTARTQGRSEIKIQNFAKPKTQKGVQYLKQVQASAGQLIKCCTDSIQQMNDFRPKSLLHQNLKFQRLRQSTSQVVKAMEVMHAKLQEQKQQLPDYSEEINQLAKSYGKYKQLDKYSISYLKSIRPRARNQIILSNRNDLIKNQAKFRNLIAEKQS